MSDFHEAVLLHEVIDALEVEKEKKYIDATIGGGGHGIEIVKHGGVVLGIDADEEAIAFTKRRWNVESRSLNLGEKNLILVNGNFKDIDKIARLHEFDSVAGILFDLGVSSFQLDTVGRGFSFLRDAPLDMRMDQSLAVSALDLINVLTKGELNELFTKLGEENFALAISDRIVRARKVEPITTTTQLANLVARVYGRRRKIGINPATKVFQALRIAVNDELNNVREGLPKAFELLKSNGRLIVISFHSLEDRIVKHTFRDWERRGRGNVLTKKPVEPKEEEVMKNARARSAKMRIIEKV